MKVAEIRQTFLDFFASKGHQIVASSPLIPRRDPTLLFTNAGMNQFKDVFLGYEKRDYSRATTSQKCVRAGGKHNDLENVGYTARHHTFFEMLGNFSFGDYFKQNAIQYAWELLTTRFNLPIEKLWITVYAEDEEAYQIWTKVIGVTPDRVIRIGDNKGAPYASDNFWTMGDTGPCGPCTEIFYDHGDHIFGGPPGSPDEDGDRYVEIWNLVFMQFNRDEHGTMHLLPKPSVDTGMGLERIAAVLQGVNSNYDIDLFKNLTLAASQLINYQDLNSPSLKVLADHIRACCFLIADGVIPGNEGRGYVLRRIIRRAIRHGYKLGARNAFFYQLSTTVIKEMGEAYPELVSNEKNIHLTLQQEEERFFQTIENGMSYVETHIQHALANGQKRFDGKIAFKLHDTYGFPLDLTADICREHQIQVDEATFNHEMNRQKELARMAGKFKMPTNLNFSGSNTQFVGYHTLDQQATILALYKDAQAVTSLQEGEQGTIILDITPFYAESGGQIGDRGKIRSDSGFFMVEDTQKVQSNYFVHIGIVETGSISVGEKIMAQVNPTLRAAITRNHSVTHLMHKALREVLGSHVQQKGSLVDTDKTRFDFAHNRTISPDEIRQVEDIVNQEILTNEETQSETMSLEQAKSSGAVMLFGEKYHETVRVITIGSSKELCGGTHVVRTGQIGLFKIIHETNVAAGIRRIEAITGYNLIRYSRQNEDWVQGISGLLKTQASDLSERVNALIEQTKSQEKMIYQLQDQTVKYQIHELLEQVTQIDQISVLAAKVAYISHTGLRQMLDQLKDHLPTSIIVLANVQEDHKINLIAGVTPSLTKRFKAGELINYVAQQVGGKGGGRADMAQAGGTQPEHLQQALSSVYAWVSQQA